MRPSSSNCARSVKHQTRSQELVARSYFFAGALCGVFTSCMTDDDLALPEKIVSEIDVSMKMMAHQVVKRDSAVAVPRGPKAIWVPAPEKVAAISVPLPCCSSTTTISTAQTNT